VITGGARGITAEVAVALAEAFRPRQLVLGRSPAPEAGEEAGLAACRDEAELRRYLLSGPARGRTPQAINERVREILARREIRHNLNRITAAGSDVVYRSVDVRDRAAVREVITRAEKEYGPVRGLIHGAGVLADRKIGDQADAQFALVYDTKVAGLHNLFDAVDPEVLEFLVLFSSSTARFGRTGQVAYAAANEYLNKWAQQAAVRLPDCRVVSFNWGPWAGGMVGDALRAVFENEGLHLIPPAEGARLVVDEIQSGDVGPGPVEIVVLAERPTPAPPEPVRTPATLVEAASPDRRLETIWRRKVDLKTLPILADHVIDGHAVLPLALILEWTVEGALHRNPGLVVRGVDNLRLFKGIVLGGREAAEVEIAAGKAVREGEEFRVPIELRGALANGREVIHARAEVLLSTRPAAGTRQSLNQPLPRPSFLHDEIYGPILFHGPAMQGIEQVEGCGERGITGRVRTSPAPSEWLERPLRSRWLTDPLTLDCAFQLVVLWTRDQLGSNSLPTAVGRYRQFRTDFGSGSVRVVAEIRHATDSRAVADIEFLDDRGDLIARLESYECVVDVSLGQAFRRNQLILPTPVTVS
jgi:NAD(P)-dependent dehydrogenase (short-subunit alcohol dehydrogenase family)